MTTVTEILNREIEIDCYLCGKGKIIIRAGDIGIHTPHHLDHKIRMELEEYLLLKTKEFFDQYKAESINKTN